MNNAKLILLVEDEIITAKAIAQAIRNIGYEVLVAHNGEDAVKWATVNAEVDLILIDIDLGPGIDGTEASRAILQKRNLPIVFLTQHIDREIVEKVKGISRYGYVVKNLDTFVLESSIQMAFELFEAHQKTLENEANLKEAQHIARMGRWELNLADQRLQWSDTINEIFEIDPDLFDASYGSFLKIIHPDDRELVHQAYLESVHNKSTYEIEHRLLMKDGRIKWFHEIGHTEYDSNDNPVRSFGTVQDITSRKLAEFELLNTKAMLEAVFDETNIPMIMVTVPDGILRMANSATHQLFNIAKEVGLIEKPIDEIPTLLKDEGGLVNFFTSLDLPLAQAIAGKKTLGKEIKILRRDGSWRWIFVSGGPIYNHKGEQIAAFTAFPDITELKQAKEALEKRIVALTQPLDDTAGITFQDLFNLDDIQRLQDEFAQATGVASIITQPDGTPITTPSNFCRLCSQIIRKTEKGLINCFRSDAALGRLAVEGATIQPCMSGGLWDAGAGISVGGLHIANWLIGQVRDETQTEENMRSYAREIQADEQDLIEAFREVPAMSQLQFSQVSRTLFTLANQLSTTAYQNVQQARFITEQKRTEDKVQALNHQLLVAYDATIEGWASALELRSQETVGHSRRVVDLTLTLAHTLGIPEKDCEDIRRGAILHDIGKMAIPDSILLKPGPLSEEEWEQMRQHPGHAYKLLSRIPFLQSAVEIPYCHHEYWNGKGYPRGIQGIEIPLPARIFTIVDVWDALTSDRPYRLAWQKTDTIAYIRSQAGIQFDPHIVEVFMQLVA